MRILLAYPPSFAMPSMPFGALGLLNACLRRRGHTTHILDINAEAFTVMSRREVLSALFEVLDRDLDRLQRIASPSAIEADYARTLRRLSVYPRDLLLTAQDAAESMQRPECFFDPATFLRMSSILRTTHAFLHAATPSLDPRNTHFVRDLFARLAIEDTDAYSFVYVSDTLPKVAALRPDVIAFTCPFSPQIATAMRFARDVRRILPDVRFVMGGTGISDAAGVVLPDPRFYDFIDHAIVGDGEESLPALIDALEGRGRLDDVPGLWRREGAVVVRTTDHAEADMNRSPAPDYTGLDFSHYRLPDRTAIYTTSRGCYYGKCTFCPESFRQGFRMRSPENVYADIRSLVLDQGIRHIHFFDPLAPPRTLVHVAREIARESLPVRWYAEVKFERIYQSPDYLRTLRDGGCRILQFGLESGVQRILDRMHKGNRLDQIEPMLDNLRRNEIACAVTWFIGFPTEDEEDARETWRYIRRHRDAIQLSLYTGTFGLGTDVPVYRSPGDYGIRIVVDDAGNPAYRRDDGRDWDHRSLHEAFFVRSDIPIAVSGASLLYATEHPELLPAISGTAAVGPPDFEDPPVADRTVAVPAENRGADLGPEAGAQSRYCMLIAATGEILDMDAADLSLLERIGTAPVAVAGVLAGETDPEGALLRIGRLLQRGALVSPAAAAAPVADGAFRAGTAPPPAIRRIFRRRA